MGVKRPSDRNLLSTQSAPVGDVSPRLAADEVCRPGKLVDALYSWLAKATLDPSH
jgi:hypothetical protein